MAYASAWFRCLQLLEACTEKLRLNSAARRVFLADGTEAHAPEDIPLDAQVYVSTGEPFLDPLAEIRGRGLWPKLNWKHRVLDLSF